MTPQFRIFFSCSALKVSMVNMNSLGENFAKNSPNQSKSMMVAYLSIQPELLLLCCQFHKSFISFTEDTGNLE